VGNEGKRGGGCVTTAPGWREGVELGRQSFFVRKRNISFLNIEKFPKNCKEK